MDDDEAWMDQCGGVLWRMDPRHFSIVQDLSKGL